MTAPVRQGFYWAKWRINDGAIAKEHDTSGPSSLWEVVQVFYRDDGSLHVWMPGVPGSQPVENYFWGPGPLAAPADPRQRLMDQSRVEDAHARYKAMTPDEREAFLIAQRNR